MCVYVRVCECMNPYVCVEAYLMGGEGIRYLGGGEGGQGSSACLA